MAWQACFLLPSRTAVQTMLVTPASLIHGEANQPRLPHDPSPVWGIEDKIRRIVLILGLKRIPTANLAGSRNSRPPPTAICIAKARYCAATAARRQEI